MRAVHSPRQSALSHRSASAVTLVFPLGADWSNATFAGELCGVISSQITQFEVRSEAGEFVRFLLPECFYSFSNLVDFNVANLIIQGNSTFPDPFDRLVTILNKNEATLLSVTYSTFLHADGSEYIAQWDRLLDVLPSLERLTIFSCALAGELPERLPASLQSLSLNNNLLSGTIPSTLFENYATISTSFASYTWSFEKNKLAGTIPASLIASMPANSGFVLTFNDNGLSGTIPETFLSLTQASTITSIQLSFSSNTQLTGTLPSDLWGLPLSMPALQTLHLLFADTSLSGTFPTTWVSQYSFPILKTILLSFADSRCSGSLHTGLIPTSAPLETYTLQLNNNPLNSPIASDFFPTLLSTAIRDASQVALYVYMSNCGITGTLTIPDAPAIIIPLTHHLTIAAPSNLLTTLSVGVNASKYIAHLDVGNNRAMQGSIENLFSSSLSPLSLLAVQNTLISGNMPFMADVDTSGLQSLLMDSVATDFCIGGSSRAVWNTTNLYTCNLSNTTASYCPDLYPAICVISDLPPLTATPIDISCPNATKPSPQFVCRSGIWVSNTPITTPVLTIPSGASETIVVGDLESTSVVFAGLGSTLTIEGCALNLTSITLTLTPDDLKGSKQIVQQLIIFASSNCSNDNLIDVVVDSRVSGSTCRKVKSSKSVSNGSLSGIFTIDSSSCNTWWIVLVSVICGVIVLGIVIFVLLVIFVPTVRLAVRPFSGPKKASQGKV